MNFPERLEAGEFAVLSQSDLREWFDLPPGDYIAFVAATPDSKQSWLVPFTVARPDGAAPHDPGN